MCHPTRRSRARRLPARSEWRLVSSRLSYPLEKVVIRAAASGSLAAQRDRGQEGERADDDERVEQDDRLRREDGAGVVEERPERARRLVLPLLGRLARGQAERDLGETAFMEDGRASAGQPLQLRALGRELGPLCLL